MANLFFTGFENVSTFAQIPGVISSANFGDPSVTSDRTPFTSGKSVLKGSLQSPGISYAATDTLFFGAAFNIDYWDYNTYFLMFGDDSGEYHVTVRIEDRSGNYGTLKVYGPTGTLLGTGTTNGIQLDTWYYIEVKVKVHDSTGEVIVKVDGTTDISITGADTRNNSAGSTSTRMFFGQTGYMYIDDVYVNDNTGSSPHNTFYGQVRVDAVLPASDSSVQFTPSSGGSNYAMVDDGASPDGDSTYNSSATAGHKDLLGLSGYSTPSGGTILGVNVVVSARRADPGTRTLRSVVKSSTTEVTGTTNTLASGYTFKKQTIFTDPATSAAFANATAINNLKVGYEIVA